ncbi:MULTISPECIES: ABC transporter permease [unclassified Streptomyces]|uniref:ABC transporter permease n=1 Tax=unclassified Streptomyces TaxID=2593676 RepID=UPI001B399F07|nr:MULTISPECIES: ABC transporter permease [unclassified Streptomyces]MBQ0864083.1 ABC transporter permease [Streptomyces sp. RK75]MBQ1120117.1 ABC transporter permease [Streptomyces sp. B15]
MASTETQPKADDERVASAAGAAAAEGAAADATAAGAGAAAGPTAAPGKSREAGSDLAGLEAGLDALDTRTAARTPLPVLLRRKALPPLVAVALVLGLWQAAFALDLKPDYQLPSPLMVWDALAEEWYKGTILSIIWQSVSRGALGFVVALAVGTPLGLLVARVRPVRAAIGPILSGLQSLPSVAWVPAAIIWFGLTDATIYAVVLLGAVPSIANGLVAGVDRIDPLHLRAGKVLGATGVSGVRHVLLPAALPGYISGLKQGWAFSWRSLMAAELIATSPELGAGLGRLLETGRSYQDMPLVLGAILLILLVGIGIELLIFAPVERRVLRHRGLLR